MKIIIGSDHAGFALKEFVKTNLKQIEFFDVGTHSVESVDYADFAHKLSSEVDVSNYTTGILICGSGEGVCMTANKYPNVRAALVWNTDVARLAKQHNNANILCLPARFISEYYAIEIIKAFLAEEFEGGRHQNRINKIPC